MTTRRIPSLDGLRAISITLVVLSHLVKWKHVSLRFQECYGTLGVQVFFVLSGYLITTLLIRERENTSSISLKNFYIRRAFRIFPAALIFIAVASIIYWKEIGLYHFGAALFYLSNMDFSRPWVFGHLWSLGVEEQFYLLWPWVMKTCYKGRTKILVGASIAAPFFVGSLHALKMKVGGPWGSLPVFADQLAIGCLLAVLGKRLPKVGRGAAVGMLSAVVFIPLFPADSAARTMFMLFVLRPLLNVSVAGLILHVIQNPYRLLNWRPISWLGQISYSVYLWQELFCSNPNLHFGFLLLVPTLGCACLSYYFVETPMLRLRERLARIWTHERSLRKADVPISPRVPISIPLLRQSELP